VHHPGIAFLRESGMKILTLTVAMLLAATSLVACATGPGQTEAPAARDYPVAPNQPDADTRRAQMYRDHSGKPIDAFLGTINDWTSLDEHSLVVWTGPNRGYLLEVMGPCVELPWAQRITFSNGGYGRLSVFDDVIVLGRQPMSLKCTIREIRPVDAKAVKQAEKAERDARKGAG
jgi:hypothetical protein